MNFDVLRYLSSSCYVIIINEVNAPTSQAKFKPSPKNFRFSWKHQKILCSLNQTLRKKRFVATGQIFCRGGWWWSRPYSGVLGSPETSRPYKWNSRAAGHTSRPYKWVRFVGVAHSPAAPGIAICRGGWWLSCPYKCPHINSSDL